MKRFGPAVLALALAAGAAACAVTPSAKDELAARGGEALRAGDYAQAEADFAEALSYDAHDPDILLSLGVIYQNTGRGEMAREIYARLIEDGRNEAAAALLELSNQKGPGAAELARQNLSDLERIDTTSLPAPAAAAETPAPSGPVDEAELRRIYADLDAMYATLDGMNARLDRYAEVVEKMAAAQGLGELRLANRPEAGEPIPLTPAASATEGAAEAPPLPALPTPPEPVPERPLAAALPAEVAPSGGDLALKVHLASFRSREKAEQGWAILKKQNEDLLGRLELDIKEIDLGPGTGVFYRVRGGPIATEAEAKALCAKLEARKLYCSVAYF